MSQTLISVTNERMLRAALTVFGEQLLSEITNREGDVDGFQLALNACMSQLPTKAVKVKADKGPSKKAQATAEKREALIDELSELGSAIDAEATLSEIKKAISTRKKEIKVEEKAVKKEEAAKIKEEKKAAIAAKKAAKKASPSKKEYTDRVLLSADKDAILGTNGSKIRISIHKETRQVLKKVEDNWTDEAHARYAELFPTGFDVKAAKKKAAPKKVKMTMAEKKAAKKAAKEAAEEAKKPSKEDKLAAEQQAIIAELVGQAVNETLTTESDDSKVEANAELEEDELEEDELEELSEGDDDEEEEEEEEPTFPGEEMIEEFDHDALSKYGEIDFYVDENANVWDENTDFVGKYDEESSALVIKEGYEPTVEEEE
jgi:hypothetical protein